MNDEILLLINSIFDLALIIIGSTLIGLVLGPKIGWGVGIIAWAIRPLNK